MAKGLSGNDHLLTVTLGGAARTHNPLPNIVVVPFTPSFLLVSFFILVLTHWKPLIWCIYTMTFLSSTVACWRSALLALPPPSQWAAGFRSIRKKEKEVELAALWCSHRFFPWALGGCPASTLQCDYACVRGVGDSVLNIYFGIYKYVNFFFFFFVWASLTPHTISCWGVAGTAVHSVCSLHPFSATPGERSWDWSSRARATSAAFWAWAVSPWLHWAAWRLPEVLGLFLRSVPHWALLGHRMFWSWLLQVVQSCFFWLGYYSPVISFLSLVSSRFLIKHLFS